MTQGICPVSRDSRGGNAHTHDTHKYTIHKYTNIQILKYTNIQIYKFTNIHTITNMHTQTHTYTFVCPVTALHNTTPKVGKRENTHTHYTQKYIKYTQNHKHALTNTRT